MGKNNINIQQSLLWAVETLKLSASHEISNNISNTAEPPNVRLEAEVLLAHVLNKDKIFLYTWPEKDLTEDQQQLFQQYIERRKQGEPIAYIIEQKEFWSLPLKVTPAVLIPRPDTEILVEAVLNTFRAVKGPISLLELGTGTGAIALALAKEQPNWRIIATDISASALNVAKINAKNLAMNHIQWLQGDWFDIAELQGLKFSAIVSNPPYIAPQDPHLLGELRYEPKNALIAENNGYFACKHIISKAAHYLIEGGWLFLEHGATQAEGVAMLFKEAHFSSIKTIKDLSDVNRVTLAQWKKY